MKRSIRVIAALLCTAQLFLLAACGEPDIKDVYTIDTPAFTTEPVTEPPATEPPATEPPATEPPATEPPATEPPATEPPATEPPATEPPATEPPATEPPATEPPATEPPATEPPATEPPATEPPATEPPATEPPATEPPATEPPVTEPPVPATPTPELSAVPTDGTLMYYESFDGIKATGGTALLGELGWTKPNKAGGVSVSSTSVINVKPLNGGKALYVTNYATGNDGSDSYYTIISGDKFKYFADRAYTVQYDLKYTDAAKADRYINIITDFGGTYYNSFHLRNSGYAHNQYYLAGKWYNYEDGNYTAKSSSTSKTSKTTIAYKLLGKYYDGTQLLSGINLSVRCVYEPDRGTSMYVRVNDAGYPGSGKWIAVSAIKDGAKGSVLPSSEFGGGGILLKVGGKQNGYVDNIVVWLGTGDEPNDKSVEYLDTAKCHQYTEHNGSVVCFICGDTYDNIEGEVWHLTLAPAYDGGDYSENAYYAGPSALDESYKLANDSKMQIVSKTSADGFAAYLAKLDGTKDLEREYYRDENGNLYASYRFTDGKNKGQRIYAYYYTVDKTARIVEEYAASISAEEFGYIYNKKDGDTSGFYQYGLSSTSVGHGMLYVIKCADNSVIIIDGGSYKHFDKAESDNLMQLLRDITGVRSPEKVRISAWIITHGHSDHVSGFGAFLGHKGGEVAIERLMYNFPSVYTDHGLLTMVRSETEKMYAAIKKSTALSKIKFYNFHTGEKIRIADIELDFIYTHEDIVDAATGKTGIAGDFNNSCSVFTVRMDGYNILITGDINKPTAPIIVRNQRTALNEASAVQTAHHLLNDIRTMYSVIKPEIVFVPAPTSRFTHSDTTKQLYALLKQYAGDEIYCQGAATTGFEVQGGKLVKIYEKKALGTKYTDWSW